MRAMRVALLATNKKPQGFQQDPAYIYRCENLGHALRAKGLDVEWGHSLTWRIPAALDCAVVHRPRVSFGMWRLVRRLKGLGARLVADVDDLVFDEALARFSPAVRNGRVPLWRQRRLFLEHRAAIKWFDHITVSTEALYEHVHRCFPGKPVTLLPNAVHWQWRRGGQPAVGRKPTNKTITYLPGTRSHDRDFALIAEPLSHFLRSHPDVQLRITGPLQHRLDLPAGQLRQAEKVPFAGYHQQFDEAWVNLAPLEDTPFNACKSALKALEAGYWEVPTICAPNRDFARYSSAGALLASDGREWLHWLERLLDTEQYLRATAGLRERTLKLADIDQRASLFLDEVLARATG
jgi:hypothetical protein